MDPLKKTSRRGFTAHRDLKTRPSSEKGFVLIAVLAVTALLAALITEVVYAVHVHSTSTAVYRDGIRAAALAQGGVELAARYLSGLAGKSGYTYFTEKEANQAIREGDGVLDIRVEDEAGKLQINSVVFSNGGLDEERYGEYARLLETLGLDRGLADSLVDWIDPDDRPMPDGAETRGYYSRLAVPYRAKGGRLYALDETLLVKGYTPAIYAKLAGYATPYTDGMVNINTAPWEVIAALSDGITADMAKRVVERREKTPFKDTAGIRDVPGFETTGFEIQGRITVKSGVFRIFSRATINGVVREVEAVVDAANSRTVYRRER